MTMRLGPTGYCDKPLHCFTLLVILSIVLVMNLVGLSYNNSKTGEYYIAPYFVTHVRLIFTSEW